MENNSNGAREIASSLHSLYDNLNLIEHRIWDIEGNLKTRNETNIRLDKKLEELYEKQNNIVYFNVSGKLIPVHKKIITDNDYDSLILKELLNKFQEDKISEILIDRNKKRFKVIIEIMRKKYESHKDNKRLNIHLSDINHSAFLEDLKYYFTEEALDKIFEDFKITYTTEDKKIKILRGPHSDLTDFLLTFEVSAEYPNESLKPYTATDINDIRKFDIKAVFCDYDANIIFTFSEPVKISIIQLRPFWFNLDIWYPGDGAGAIVYYSNDKVNWEFLTMISEDYGCDMEMTHTLIFEEKELQYLKFEAKSYALSIAYIKIS